LAGQDTAPVVRAGAAKQCREIADPKSRVRVDGEAVDRWPVRARNQERSEVFAKIRALDDRQEMRRATTHGSRGDIGFRKLRASRKHWTGNYRVRVMSETPDQRGWSVRQIGKPFRHRRHQYRVCTLRKMLEHGLKKRVGRMIEGVLPPGKQRRDPVRDAGAARAVGACKRGIKLA
jgi:hypothetical protein